MRQINSFKDANIALRELFDWKTLKSTKDWDFNRLKITNASPATDPNDYVILSQLPGPQNGTPGTFQPYQILWSSEAPVVTGQLIPTDYEFTARNPVPSLLWVNARVAGVADMAINLNFGGNDLLSTDLVYPAGQIDQPVTTSTFNFPIPRLGVGVPVVPIIRSADGIIAVVSIGLVLVGGSSN